ncbi:hypothetical protein GDO81_006342 [Engystomops pustulosus]|uniref:Uncharacterized protein n=1 Tax=Engystomops pustulosus TaxID=76066 RepID=A0AAV7CX45_ENGPU|nr:hypothetical protein GDO81_006342 [Engystomops pustulosus]
MDMRGRFIWHKEPVSYIGHISSFFLIDMEAAALFKVTLNALFCAKLFCTFLTKSIASICPGDIRMPQSFEILTKEHWMCVLLNK